MARCKRAKLKYLEPQLTNTFPAKILASSVLTVPRYFSKGLAQAAKNDTDIVRTRNARFEVECGNAAAHGVALDGKPRRHRLNSQSQTQHPRDASHTVSALYAWFGGLESWFARDA